MTFRPALAVAVLTLLVCSGQPEATDGAPHVVTITARDFAFDAPDTMPSGWVTIRLVNEGPDIHHAQLLRFDEGRTLADFLAALQAGGPPPAWAHDAGGPNPPMAGQSTNATQFLEPGNYAVVCFVDTPDHVPHITKGMSHAFVVTESAVATVEPTADITVRLVDYAFDYSTPLTAGSHTLRVENGAQQPHEIALIRLSPGKTLGDLMAWAEAYAGSMPGEILGGVAAIGPGSTAYFSVDLTPGDYALLCFVPDAGDAKPHVMHGMAHQLTIS